MCASTAKFTLSTAICRTLPLVSLIFFLLSSVYYNSFPEGHQISWTTLLLPSVLCSEVRPTYISAYSLIQKLEAIDKIIRNRALETTALSKIRQLYEHHLRHLIIQTTKLESEAFACITIHEPLSYKTLRCRKLRSFRNSTNTSSSAINTVSSNECTDQQFGIRCTRLLTK